MLKIRIIGGLIAIASMACGPAQAAPDCQNLKPGGNPGQNSKSIAECLASPQASAKLSNAVFLVNHAIKMPPGSTLTGSGGTVIKPAAGYKDNSIIALTGGNAVKDISLIADGRLKLGCCTAAVSFMGSRSRLDNVDISDVDVASLAHQAAGARIAGIYFIGTAAAHDNAAVHDNVAAHVKIHGLNFGVIYRKELTVAANNRIEDSEIFDIACDAATGGVFVQGSRIHDNGFDCKQKPTPIAGGGSMSMALPEARKSSTIQSRTFAAMGSISFPPKI